MNHLSRLNHLTACSFLLLGVLGTAPLLADGPAAGAAPTVVVDQPRPVNEVVLARPFILEQPFEFDWRAERPLVKSGWIIVVAVDKALVAPRQLAEPVLYVGGQTAERLNLGHGSGRLVVIVPAPLDEAGAVRSIVSAQPTFFGAAMLPEQVDAATIAREIGAAKAAGVATITAEAEAVARVRGGDLLRVHDRAALLAATAPVVRTFAPDEQDRAQLLEGRPLEHSAR